MLDLKTGTSSTRNSRLLFGSTNQLIGRINLDDMVCSFTQNLDFGKRTKQIALAFIPISAQFIIQQTEEFYDPIRRQPTFAVDRINDVIQFADRLSRDFGKC